MCEPLAIVIPGKWLEYKLTLITDFGQRRHYGGHDFAGSNEIVRPNAKLVRCVRQQVVDLEISLRIRSKDLNLKFTKSHNHRALTTFGLILIGSRRSQGAGHVLLYIRNSAVKLFSGCEYVVFRLYSQIRTPRIVEMRIVSRVTAHGTLRTISRTFIASMNVPSTFSNIRASRLSMRWASALVVATRQMYSAESARLRLYR